MNYQVRNKNNPKIKILVGIIILVILIGLFVPHSTSGLFAKIFSPLWRLEDSVLSAEIFTSHANLVSENTSLRQQLESLDAASSSIALLGQENGELKALLGRPSSKNTILAVVLKKPPFSNYDTIVIDIGSDYGVKNGDIVYALSPISNQISSSQTSSTTASTSSTVSVPIGLISEVYSNISNVKLFSSPGEKYNIEIGQKHISAVAIGRGGGTFEVTLPREANIRANDLVILPSISPTIFATVSAIVTDPARPYATILFQSQVNPFELHWVTVNKK